MDFPSTVRNFRKPSFSQFRICSKTIKECAIPHLVSALSYIYFASAGMPKLKFISSNKQNLETSIKGEKMVILRAYFSEFPCLKLHLSTGFSQIIAVVWLPI